jgi:tRNA threonylcarbamoyl adenosine modification protein (Sua5/YciO/YrdC/YwlC family)
LRKALLQKPFFFAVVSACYIFDGYILYKSEENVDYKNDMIISINEQNPQIRFIEKAVEALKRGSIIIYPTDTVYAYGCDMNSRSSIERIYRMKKLPRNKPLSFIFSDLSELHSYVRNISDSAFRIMKKALPGPYTFIFKASKLVPQIAITNQKSIGIRIPDNNVAISLVKRLGRPIISASVVTAADQYIVKPSELDKQLLNEVDLIIDCGAKISEVSTIIDFSRGDVEIIRKGKGELFFL